MAITPLLPVYTQDDMALNSSDSMKINLIFPGNDSKLRSDSQGKPLLKPVHEDWQSQSFNLSIFQFFNYPPCIAANLGTGIFK